jgi:ribosome-associated toxin RatA of RatAB toxin-antitoxin module
MRAYILLFFLTAISPVFGQEWKLEKEEEGVLVYTKDNGTPYRTVQTVAVVKSSMSEVLAMVMNVTRFPEWIFKCQSAKVLERRSENEIIHYQVNSVPFIKNRDLVILLTKTEDTNGEITVTQKALPEYYPRQGNLVRITKFDGVWNLKSVEGGVEVKYTVTADPGSDLPRKLVNKATVTGPLETMLNMRRILETKAVAPVSR